MRMTTRFVAALALLTLGACSASPADEPAPQAPAPTTVAVDEAADATTPEATAAPKDEPERDEIRIELIEHHPALVKVSDAGTCSARTNYGDLAVVYTGINGSQVELSLGLQPRQQPDLTCEFDTSPGERVSVNRDLGAHLVLKRSSGQVEKLLAADISDRGRQTVLRFEVGAEVYDQLGLDTAVRDTQVAYLDALRDHGMPLGVNNDARSELNSAQAACSNLQERAEGDDPDAVVAHMIRYADSLKDQLIVQHLCPQFQDSMDLAVRGHDGGVRTVVSDPDPKEREIGPGTYRTLSGQTVTHCYWERATGNGQIIANDFITAATDGVRVTVNEGETFISRDCGEWVPVN